MIRYLQGDLFDSPSPTLVNAVNCVGVMGAGIALQFRKRFPRMYAEYVRHCRAGVVRPGQIMAYREAQGTTIVNFPTKRHWRDSSSIEDIRSGLSSLRAFIVETGIRSIGIPALGCGLGGLSWPVVRATIEDTLGDLPDVDVQVYEPAESR